MSPSYIEPLQSGDTSIPERTINTIINSVNSRNVSSIDPTTAVAQINDGRSVQDILTGTEDDYPFKIESFQTSKLSVTKGSWNRDQTIVELGDVGGVGTQDEYIEDQIVIDFDEFTPSKVADTTYYVYVELAANASSTTYLYDPSLIPGQLEIKVTSDADEAHQRDPNYATESANASSLTTRDFWVKDREVIGTVTLGNTGTNWYVSSIKQELSSDISDSQIIADGISDSTSSEGFARSTINNNFEVDTNESGGSIHFGELQIHDVNLVPGGGASSTLESGNQSRTAPYFRSANNPDDLLGCAGQIDWATYDTHYFPSSATQGAGIASIRTINLIEDENSEHTKGNSGGEGYEVITLRNVETTQNDSKSMPYYFSTDTVEDLGMAGELNWASLDTHLHNVGFQESIEIHIDANGSGSNVVQIFDFDIGGTHTMVAADRIIVRDADGGAGGPGVKYASTSDIENWIYGGDLCAYIEANCDIQGWVDGVAKHTNLVDIILGYYDHDHGGYWQNVDSVTGRIGGPDWDYLVNNGSSIGDALLNKVIDLDNRTLDQAGTDVIKWGTAEVQIDTVLLDVNCSGAIQLNSDFTSWWAVGTGDLTLESTTGDLILDAPLGSLDLKQGALIAFHVGSLTEVKHTNEVLVTSTTSFIALDASGDITYDAGGDHKFDTGDIINAGDYYQGANQGFTGTFWANNGTSLVTCSGGLVTSVA